MAFFFLLQDLIAGQPLFTPSLLVRRIESWTGGSFAIPALALLLILEGGFLVLAAALSPGVVDQLGQGPILMANVLTAVAMIGFLRYAHGTAEAEKLDAPGVLHPAPR